MIIGIGIGLIMAGIINVVIVHNPTNGDSFVKPDNSTETCAIPQKGAIEDIEEKGDDSSINEENIADNTNEETDYYEIHIEKGMNSIQIAKLLEREGIIANSEEFISLANQQKVDKVLRYGFKKIPMNSSIEEILEILVKGTK